MRHYFQHFQWAFATVLITVLLSGLSTPVWADAEQARVMLDQMSHSFRELNYQGAFSFQQGDTTQSLRITHAVIDGEEYERLEYMDGERREIIRRGHHLTCIHPGHELVRLYQQHENLKQSADFHSSTHLDVGDFYELSIVDQGRIAGRDSVEVLVSPKDTHRFVHRLSLDKETGLLLRSIVVGGAGKVLERFQFADIQIGENISMDRFKQGDNSYQAEHVDPESESSGQPKLSGKRHWMVNWLPGGFTTVVANQKFASEDMATFTDGFSVFSVFLEKMDKTQSTKSSVDNSGEGLARRGATVAYSRALVLSGTPHRVTVVGEIPKQTARQVAQSVALAQ
jgi:sigma-E factor negative regulatory protein RseB